jgi:hypothetical protein
VNAIPPAYTEYLGRQLMEQVTLGGEEEAEEGGVFRGRCVMTQLQSRALAREPMTAAEVERVYENLRGRGFVGDLCESHERLRAELEGATVLLAEREAEIARLREQIASHCERIAKQSELLSRKAERSVDAYAYAIAPLVWVQHRNADHDHGEWWTANTVFGDMSVENGRSQNGICWRYCFDEYYDEDLHACDSIDTGKAEAEAFYLSRLLPALVASGAGVSRG